MLYNILYYIIISFLYINISNTRVTLDDSVLDNDFDDFVITPECIYTYDYECDYKGDDDSNDVWHDHIPLRGSNNQSVTADTADDILYNLKYINNSNYVIDYNSIYKYITDVTLDIWEFNDVKWGDIGNVVDWNNVKIKCVFEDKEVINVNVVVFKDVIKSERC